MVLYDILTVYNMKPLKRLGTTSISGFTLPLPLGLPLVASRDKFFVLLDGHFSHFLIRVHIRFSDY